MNHYNIDRILQIVNICLPDADLNSGNQNDNLEGYDFDSIAMIRVIIAIEEEFHIEIPNQFHLIEEMNTINKIIAILNNLMEAERAE